MSHIKYLIDKKLPWEKFRGYLSEDIPKIQNHLRVFDECIRHNLIDSYYGTPFLFDSKNVKMIFHSDVPNTYTTIKYTFCQNLNDMHFHRLKCDNEKMFLFCLAHKFDQNSTHFLFPRDIIYHITTFLDLAPSLCIFPDVYENTWKFQYMKRSIMKYSAHMMLRKSIREKVPAKYRDKLLENVKQINQKISNSPIYDLLNWLH